MGAQNIFTVSNYALQSVPRSKYGFLHSEPASFCSKPCGYQFLRNHPFTVSVSNITVSQPSQETVYANRLFY